MENLLTSDISPAEAAHLRELVERCLAALRESNARSEGTLAEIAELQAETRVLLAQLRATLNVEAGR
jgi:hypothetical protein